MSDMPERIWLDWPGANHGEPIYTEPPERDTQAGQTEYIRADLALPAVQPDPREAALRDIARQKKSDEMDTEYDVEYAEFEGGYNAIIDVARVALRAVQPDTVQAQIDAAVLAERERCAVIADAQEARAAAREKEAPDDENDFANGLLFGTKIGARIIAAEIRKGDQPDAHVNETPKSEHDAANVLTRAAKGIAHD